MRTNRLLVLKACRLLFVEANRLLFVKQSSLFFVPFENHQQEVSPTNARTFSNKCENKCEKLYQQMREQVREIVPTNASRSTVKCGENAHECLKVFQAMRVSASGGVWENSAGAIQVVVEPLIFVENSD